jgi:DNA-binding transcriptional ArsR family regulator
MAKKAAQKRTEIDLKNPLVFKIMFQKITRRWSVEADLSGNEISVLMFVLDRTLGWGKDWEAISKSHFETGFLDRKTGERWAGKVGMTRRTIDATLRRLIDEKKLILERPGSEGEVNRYALNREWKPEMMIVNRAANTGQSATFSD